MGRRSYEPIAKAIDDALAGRIVGGSIAQVVDVCFRRTADQDDALDFEAVVGLAAEIARRLSLPEKLFADLPGQLDMFDFDGSGTLDKMEVICLFKQILQTQRYKLCGRKPVEVPWMSMEQAGYSVTKELGRGGQGAMYLCKRNDTGVKKQYCIKFYDKNDKNAGGLGSLVDEYDLMLSLDNKHIAKTYEVFQDKTFYYLVNEPYLGGDFSKLTERAYQEGVNMTESWWRGLFKQVMDGLAFLHSKGIMHCDIKEPNIMVARNDSYKNPVPVLIDFGLASSFLATEAGVCGTPGYIPPETWQTEMWIPCGDTFSMGIVFFQLLTGRVPSKAGPVHGVLQMSSDYANAARKTPLPWDDFPDSMPELQKLIECMTIRQRTKRPKPAQVLSHPWFSSDSDSSLPAASLRRIVGRAAAHAARDSVRDRLVCKNQLSNLQKGFDKFCSLDPDQKGAIDATVAAKLLGKLGVDSEIVQKVTSLGSKFSYVSLMQDAMKIRRRLDDHFIRDLFELLDANKSGSLDRDELAALICSGAFDIEEGRAGDEVSEWIRRMDSNGDGMISLEEFARTALKDGRILQRANCMSVVRKRIVHAMARLHEGEEGAKGSQCGRRSACDRDLVGSPCTAGRAEAGSQQTKGRATPSSGSAELRQRSARLASPRGATPPRCVHRQDKPARAGRELQRCASHPPASQPPAKGGGAKLASPRRRDQARRGTWSQDDGHNQYSTLAVTVVSARDIHENFRRAALTVTCRVHGSSQAAFTTPASCHAAQPAWHYDREVFAQRGDAVDFALFAGDQPVGSGSLSAKRFDSKYGFDGDLTLAGPPGSGIRAILRVRVRPLATGAAE